MTKKRIKKPIRRKKKSDYPGEMSFRKALGMNPVVMQVGGSPDDVDYDSPEYRKAYTEGKLVSRLNSDPEDFVRAGTLPAYNFDALQETGRDIKEVYPNFNSLTEEEKRYFRDTSPIGRSIRRKAEKGNKSFTDEVNEFATGMLYQTPMAALQIPQSALIEGVQALRGKDANWQSVYDPYKQRVPSDVWGFETTDDMSWYNPRVIGNFAMDMIADPTNLVGAGFLKSPIKAAIRTTLDPTGLFELTGKGFNQGKKFLVRNTPLRNAYKLNPNARTAFANLGETPHWLRGFQEEWNPTTPNQFQEMSDFLKKADDKYTELINLSRPYSKAESNLERYWIRYQDAIRKGDKKLQEQLIKKMDREIGVQNTPLNSYFNKLGSGSYGDVYSLNSNQALKKWHTPEQLPTNVDDIIEKHRQLPSDLQSRTIIPKKGAFSKADRVEIMPKVEGAKDMKPLNQATPAEMEQVLKEVDELNKSGIYVDISNPENILINPKTGKATYLDLNTSQNIISGKRYPKELEMLLTQREIPRQLPGSPNAVSGVDDVSRAVADTPQPWQMQELPGLHLKSTMTDGPISKIVEPKTGLINTEQALAIIGKESGGADKVALIRQALGDNIPKKMDYNEFRKVVQDQLIPLETKINPTGRSEYGLERIGYYDEPPMDRGALTLSNKNKFGRGSSAHGNPDETLGHIHFLRDAETPDVLTVTQMQSDAFQGTHRIMPKVFNEAAERQSLKFLEEQAINQGKLHKQAIKQKDGSWLYPDGTKVSDKIHNEFSPKTYNDLIAQKQAEIENFTQKQLLDKNHQERYLQELVDYAGKRGDVNKIRVPTSETAAKVQGYTPTSYDAGKTYFQGNKNDVMPKYLPEHQTILKKYSEQPKTIKKLFGVEPKIVTDSKGNTWYEFDIPKKFKEGKGEIKAFGLIPPAAIIGAGVYGVNQMQDAQPTMRRFGGNLKFQKGGDYNMQRALELGYTPDEAGHYPSVDEETGMWLKSKQHPTAWMEYMQGYALNPENNRRFDVVPNVEGYFGENQLQYVDKKQIGGRIKFQRGGSLTTPTSASFLNRDRMNRGVVEGPSVFEDVMAGLYGAGEGLLDAATMGATDEFTDMGFKALQGAAGTTGEDAQQQQGYAGVGNVVGAIGGAALGIASPEQAVTQSVKGAGKAVSGFSGSPEGDAAGQAIQQIPGLMGNFKDMKTFMASRGGRFRYQQGGQMLNQNLGLTEIGGPSHAEGGVTLPNNGQGPDVEVEGPETIYTPENYVMSEKIKASKTALREAGISEKYAGKSYADISKAIKKQGGDKLRPNDRLTLNFIDSEMKKLIKAHDIDRQLQEQKNVVAASPEEQQAGYNMYPDANSIAFPGSGPTQVVPTNNNDPIMVTGADGSQQMLVDQPIQTQAPFVEEKMARGGQMIKRADGSYSRRGLWDNIRANRGSGKKPTKQMLEQERKIKAAEKAYGGYYAEGGSFDNPGFRALPEYVQAKIKSNMEVGGYMDYDDTMEYGKGGYTVRRSNDRKGKTHVVTGPDGTKKYFGDPKLGERGKSKYGKKAFYARHKKNLAKNPYFRAYARATWEDGGYMDMLNANVDILDMDTSMYAYGGPMMYAQGGIHIDPSKRGTFKAQASKMGMGVQEAASTILNAPEGKYSPAMRKKANFARNFAKEDGGYYQMGGDMMQPQQMPQQGGGQEEAAQQIIQQVAQMLQQNVAPEQVVGKLIEMGVPQQQAVQIVEMVAQQMQGQQQPAMQQQMPPQAQPPGMMRYGGRIKKQAGDRIPRKEITPVDTSGLDSLAAEMQPIKIPTSLDYTVEGPSLEEFKALSVGKPKPKPEIPEYKTSLGNYIAGGAGSMVGPLGNIAAAAFAPDPTYAAAPKFQKYDYTPVALQQAAGNQALANTREGFRRGAPTQGSYLSNMAVASPSMAMNLGEALAKTRYGIDTSNIGIANQEAQLAAAQAEKNALLKDQSIANRWQLGLKGAEGIGKNVQSFSKDMGAKSMQDMLLNQMKTGDFSVIGYELVDGKIIPKLAPSGLATYDENIITLTTGEKAKYNPETGTYEIIE